MATRPEGDAATMVVGNEWAVLARKRIDAASAEHLDQDGYCSTCCRWEYVVSDPDASYVEWPCSTWLALNATITTGGV